VYCVEDDSMLQTKRSYQSGEWAIQKEEEANEGVLLLVVMEVATVLLCSSSLFLKADRYFVLFVVGFVAGGVAGRWRGDEEYVACFVFWRGRERRGFLSWGDCPAGPERTPGQNSRSFTIYAKDKEWLW